LISRRLLQIRRWYVLAAVAVFAVAGFATQPSSALAAPGQRTVRTVLFDEGGIETTQQTDALTVGEFLQDRHIEIGANDYLAPAADVAVTEGLSIDYRPAVPVRLQVGVRRFAVRSAAVDVGELLDEAHVALGPDDRVNPALGEAVPAGGTVRVDRVVSWTRVRRQHIAPEVVHRLDASLSPYQSRTIAAGSPGERDVTIRFERVNGGAPHLAGAVSKTIRQPHRRVVADGIGYDSFARLAARGIAHTELMARNAMHMVATAYSASCAGCSGMTAIGRRAGHGIVAVDPSVIPLGTALFIPGYGVAIAGDTGGAIRGNRIDLGFDSSREAMEFGRRDVTVYRLHR
jgi:3D (Asp-Asp-Asp) domain-containing protein